VGDLCSGLAAQVGDLCSGLAAKVGDLCSGLAAQVGDLYNGDVFLRLFVCPVCSFVCCPQHVLLLTAGLTGLIDLLNALC